MPLSSGTKLGPYEILSKIGAGGMGEVYRARDTRLERTVAIKVLPSEFSRHADLRKRLEREARTLSSLTHPHICSLYDVGQQNGTDFLVMEYLEGETLAHRLLKGALSAGQVLQYGIEIADALERAHRHGIIHRDLKPGNIMLTKDGAKLLDFGLARVESPAAPLNETVTVLEETQDEKLTEKGLVLGTFQYMAPEQLEGKEADARSDIFALGAVVYEMATGKPAFSGANRTSLITAILASEPPAMASLQPLTPPALERVVKMCLAKDPDTRWQTAHDVRLQLEWIGDAGSQAGVPRVKGQRRITRERLAWASALFLLLAFATTFVMRHFQPSSPPPRKIMFTVELPPGYKPTPDATAALSPDGAQIAYAVTDAKGKESLWVRALESLSPRRLEGSERTGDYYSLTWTTDGKSVVAAADGKLVRLSATGGANEVLCDKFDAYPSTINRDGTILAWTAPPTKIMSVSLDDCTLRDKSPSDAPGSGVGYGYPHFLPDGNHFLFAAIRKDKHHEVLLGSLNDPKTRVLVRNGSHPKYVSSGYILFSRDGYLMAQRFDAKSNTTSGEPFLAYPNQLRFYAAFGWAAFDVSRNGFISAQEQNVPPMLLRWYDQSGQVLKTLGEPEYAVAPRLNAQETHVLGFFFNPRTHAGDVWSLDLEHGTRRRESFHDRPGGGPATWTARGERIVYSVLLGTHLEMFIKNAGSSDNGLTCPPSLVQG